LRQLRRNVQGALAGRDPEYLHQLRVAVRRLRVLITLTHGTSNEHEWRHVTSELKWLAHALGPARDSDVFISDIWPPLRAEIGASRLVAILDAAWLAQRRRHWQKAQLALAARRFQALLSLLERYLALPGFSIGEDSGAGTSSTQNGTRFMHEAIRRRVRRVRQRHAIAGKAQNGAASRLHRLRIAIKKLRYVLDFFAPLLQPRRVTKAQRSLARLQDILGGINDISVAEVQVTLALRRRRGIEVERLHKTLSAWRKAKLKVLQRQFESAWKAYREVKILRLL
jgi:triphosphatase